MVDVTDATFETEVVEASHQAPVVVDLWAEWCGPCRTLGPILERVIDATEGKVRLAKVDVDANPAVAQAFRVQGIPAVYALRDGKVVDGFVGAQSEPYVKEFVAKLVVPESEAGRLVETAFAVGDPDVAEPLLRQALDLEPGHEQGILALAGLLVERGDTEEALALLERIPESAETRQLAARARLGERDVDVSGDGVESLLDGLLGRVKEDDAARQEFIDILEGMGPDDPRTATYRKALTSRLF